MEAIKTSVTNSPAESEVKGKAVKKSGKRIGYNYIILKSLKESQKNDVVKCLYIKSLTNFGICVIKEGTYGDSKDKQGRDIKDRLMWQRELHEKLQDKVRLPRLLGNFEENGNYYLVLERIKGKSLYKACKDAGKDLREGLITGNKLGMKFLGYMIQMIELLETLHKHGIVHRDVTATNFMITPRGKVAVIDMELSYSLERGFPEPPFALGTYGYMSPEQELTAKPTVEQDVFSIGAILLQMCTGLSPIKMTNARLEELIEKIKFFVSDKILGDFILQCLHPDPSLRPTLSNLKGTLKALKHDFITKSRRVKSVGKKYNKSQILKTCQEAIGTLSSPLLADEEKGWFSENTNIPYNPDKRKINKGWYASFSKGASGVIYMLSKANKLCLDIAGSKIFIQKGIDLIESKYISRIEDASPGLHFGSSGIAAVLATCITEGLIEQQTSYLEWINLLLEKESAVYGYQHGLSGQGIANILCKPIVNYDLVSMRVQSYVNRILESQKDDGSWLRVNKANKARATRGFAHGVAGIIYFLLHFGSTYNNKESLAGAERGLEWLTKKAEVRNGVMIWRSSENKEIAPWWCEGAGGIGLTFLKGYSILGDIKWKRYCTGALLNHEPNVVDNNLSQCHGLSGLGEIYLEAFRVFESEQWLNRADWIAQVLMQVKKRHSQYGPYWLVEHERQPVADFMTGNSGIIHYLLRYCFPDKIGFPMV